MYAKKNKLLLKKWRNEATMQLLTGGSIAKISAIQYVDVFMFAHKM